MKTFHVGSLPFMDLKPALNYSFSYDIPTLFTLPKLDSRQLLGLDLLYACQIGEGSYDNLKVGPLAKAKITQFTPYYLKEFKQYLRATQNHSGAFVFKYQCVGPISLFRIISKNQSIKFDQVLAFLHEIYAVISEKLSPLGEVIFVIDEPFLAQSFEYYPQLEQLISTINSLFSKTMIHCCDYLTIEQRMVINFPLNLDLKLYQSRDELIQPDAPGVTLSLEGASKVDNKYFKNAEFLTPACGLAYFSEAQLSIVLAQLNHIKNQTHPI